MGVGHSGFEIGDEVGPVKNEDYVAALVRFDNGAVGTLANPTWGQWAHFQPAIGTSMGFDDMKVIEAQQFLSSIATSTQLAPSAADAWCAAEVDEAVVASAADGAWHAVPRVSAPPPPAINNYSVLTTY